MLSLRTKKLILPSSIFIFLLLFSSLVVAQPPFVSSVSNDRLIISSNLYSVVKQNQDFALSFHVYNSSSGSNLSGNLINCSVHLQGPQGKDLMINYSIKYDVHEWDIILNKSNFTEVGDYSLEIWCLDGPGFSGSERLFFEVTPSGNSSWFDYTSLMLIFLMGSYIIVFISWNKDEYIPMLLAGLFIMLFSILAINNSLGELIITNNSFYLILTYFNLALGMFFSLGAGFKLLKEGL